jgi:hypothetical protein
MVEHCAPLPIRETRIEEIIRLAIELKERQARLNHLVRAAREVGELPEDGVVVDSRGGHKSTQSPGLSGEP